MKYFICEFADETCAAIEAKIKGQLHQLNNYLTNVLGFSEVLFSKLEEEKNVEAMKMVVGAAEKAIHCSREISVMISMRGNSRPMVIEANNKEEAKNRYLASIEAYQLNPENVTAREVEIVKIWDND